MAVIGYALGARASCPRKAAEIQKAPKSLKLVAGKMPALPRKDKKNADPGKGIGA